MLLVSHYEVLAPHVCLSISMSLPTLAYSAAGSSPVVKLYSTSGNVLLSLSTPSFDDIQLVRGLSPPSCGFCISGDQSLSVCHIEFGNNVYDGTLYAASRFGAWGFGVSGDGCTCSEERRMEVPSEVLRGTGNGQISIVYGYRDYVPTRMRLVSLPVKSI
ncbi:hypothetical protein E1B28_002099 [Marasmius oreades]|uniref:Uncharacterized protein n=1 Tax=Marasmius oreades TaxID=181124 RepID=A0A9P7RN10_9AGAR|nr:uncharacterized protein E1B28_002099 [Marasmius oreades]KAG7086140.1 hypothetical protein E1B28_002099 [Marasmius oreades]